MFNKVKKLIKHLNLGFRTKLLTKLAVHNRIILTIRKLEQEFLLWSKIIKGCLKLGDHRLNLYYPQAALMFQQGVSL
jgi:hypothetical protein